MSEGEIVDFMENFINKINMFLSGDTNIYDFDVDLDKINKIVRIRCYIRVVAENIIMIMRGHFSFYDLVLLSCYTQYIQRVRGIL